MSKFKKGDKVFIQYDLNAAEKDGEGQSSVYWGTGIYTEVDKYYTDSYVCLVATMSYNEDLGYYNAEVSAGIFPAECVSKYEEN